MPITIDMIKTGIKTIDSYIDKYNKVDETVKIDGKTAKNINTEIQKYAILSNLRGNTSIKTVLEKLNDYKILLDGQKVAYETTGRLKELNSSPLKLLNNEPEKNNDTSIPILSNKSKK